MSECIVASEILDVHMIMKYNSKKDTYTISIVDADWINEPRKYTYTKSQMHQLTDLLKLRRL